MSTQTSAATHARRQKNALSGLLATLFVTAVARGAPAADAVVGTGTSASCTEAALNSAVAAVNVSPGGTITFACGGLKTINLTSQKVFNNASANYAIDGGGLITLSGQNVTRIILHLGGTLSLRNITLRNGRAIGTDDSASGGAIRSDNGGVVLNLTNVTFLNNVTNITGATTPPFSPFDYGGAAVFTRLGQLTVTNCTFSNNTATNSSGGAIHGRSSTIDIAGSAFTANVSNAGGFGGALYIDGVSPSGANGTLDITYSTFVGNSAYNIGGAFYFYLHPAENETATIDTVAFLDNHVVENSGTIGFLGTRGIGGGGSVDNGNVVVLNTTFADNSAQSSTGPGSAGGLSLSANASIQITNSTFSGNRAEGPETDSSGGGLVIYNSVLPFQITNSTIASNYAWWTGGGIQSDTNGVLTNTIVANNVADNGGNPWNIMDQCAEQLVNGGGAMQYPDIIGPEGPFNRRCANGVTVANPLLTALADNGGFTLTHALGAGSPAIDTGSCVVSRDQRGASRPQGSGCDRGSFEVLTSIDLIFEDGFES